MKCVLNDAGTTDNKYPGKHNHHAVAHAEGEADADGAAVLGREAAVELSIAAMWSQS